jgi:hypothetical protein
VNAAQRRPGAVVILRPGADARRRRAHNCERRPALGALALSFILVTSANAQEMSVRGRVLGPDGTPLAIERVVLHRVDRGGGATVAEAPSGADGRFTLNAPASSDTSAVYFVAARYEKELYIGPPFRPATQGTPEQVLQVGVPANSASALLADAQQDGAPPLGRRGSSRNALLLIAPLLIAGSAVLYLVLPRRRVAPARAMLMRIAEIDERLPDAPQGQREALRAERTRLVEQLRAG